MIAVNIFIMAMSASGLEHTHNPCGHVCLPLHEQGHGLEEVICTWTLGGGNTCGGKDGVGCGPERLLLIGKTKKF